MRLLLDTHSFLWFIADDPKLSARARQAIGDGDTEVMLSMASVWELAIKVSIGKLTVEGTLESFVPEQLQRNDIKLLTLPGSKTWAPIMALAACCRSW